MALAVSYTVKRTVNEGLKVAYYSGKKEVLILIAYFVAIVAFSVALPNILN
ncbi:hypothetical protein [Maribacter caenipelagi]|uniref:hypothetical protein n=1 Tax=Maribacter caenipelagi TaxID=1447781 RepID=UPI001FB9B3B5|nr:hypothetical protein [Maribacter caenipelagi]